MQILIQMFLITIQVFIVVISIYFSMKMYHKRISPICIYSCINSASIILYLVNMLNYYQLDNFVILILILSELTLLVGCIFGNALFNSLSRVKPVKTALSDKLLNKTMVIHRSMHIIALIAIVGAIMSAKRVLTEYSLSFLLENPAYLQFSQFQQQYIGYMNLLGIMVLPMFCYYFIETRRICTVDIFFVCLTFVGLFLSGIKGYIIISIITALLVYIQTSLKVRIRYIAISIVICIAFFIFYTNYIDIFSTSSGISKFPSFLKGLESPYSYMTSGWAAFTFYGANSTGTVFQYKGYVVLSAVFKVLSFFGLTDKIPFEPLAFVPTGIYSSTNVYTMVGEVYLDVGPVGLVIVYFIIGLLCAYIYNLSLQIENLSAIFVSALLMYCLFISFFLYFFNFDILFLCITTCIVIKISRLTLLDRGRKDFFR